MNVSQLKHLSFLCIVSLTTSYLVAPLVLHKRQLPVNYITAPNELVNLRTKNHEVNIRAIKVFKDNPLKIELFFDPTISKLDKTQRQKTVTRLCKQFISAVTTPEKNLWINLSPFEKDRIIDHKLSKNYLGRDLLTQDYMLKQISATLTNPETRLGKKYWENKENQSDNHNFTKIWIVPGETTISSSNTTAIIEKSSLSLRHEQDYLAQKQDKSLAQESKQDDSINTILPELEKALKNSPHFARLRQLYNCAVLASWYKAKTKDTFLSDLIVNKNINQGLTHQQPTIKSDVYNLYLESFNKGTYSTSIQLSPTLPKKNYFSGGVALDNLSSAIEVKKRDSDQISAKLHAYTVDLSFNASNIEQRINNKKATAVLEFITEQLGHDQDKMLKLWQDEIELYQILNKDHIREDYLVIAANKELVKAEKHRILDSEIKKLEQTVLSLRSTALQKRSSKTKTLIKDGIIKYNSAGEIIYETSVLDLIQQSPFMKLFKVLNLNGGWETMHELAHKGKFSNELRRIIHYARRQFIIAVLREAYMRVHKTNAAPADNSFVGIFGSDNWIFSDLDISAKGGSGNLIICEYYAIIDELFGAEVYTEKLFDSNIYAGFIGLNKMIIGNETLATNTELLGQREEIAAFTSVLMSVDKVSDKLPVTKAFGNIMFKMNQAPHKDLYNHYNPLIEKASMNYIKHKSLIQKANFDPKFRKEKHIEYLQKITRFFQDNNVVRDNDGFFYFADKNVFAQYLDLVITLKQLEIDAYHTPSAINSTVNNKQIASNNRDNTNYNDFTGKLNYSQGVLVAALEHLGKVIERSNPRSEFESNTETFIHILKYIDRIVQESESFNLNIAKTGYITFPQSVKRSVRSVAELEALLDEVKSVYFSRRLDKAELFIESEIKSGFAAYAEISKLALNAHKDLIYQNHNEKVLSKIITESIEQEVSDIGNLSKRHGREFLKNLGSFKRFIFKASELLTQSNSDILSTKASSYKKLDFDNIILLANDICSDLKIKPFERLRILKAIRRTLTSDRKSKHRRTNDGDKFRINVVNKQLVSVANSIVFNIMVKLYSLEKGNYYVSKYTQDRYLFSSFSAEQIKNRNVGGIDLEKKDSFHENIEPIIFSRESYNFDDIENSNLFSFCIQKSYNKL